MILGQPIASDRFAPHYDLCHFVSKSRLMPRHPELGTCSSLLVAGALPTWSATRPMPMAIEVSHPDIVVDTLGHGDPRTA